MRPVEILIIEDNAGDILLISEALGREPVRTSLHLAMEGEQAIEMLAKRDVKPDMVILDLTLPKLCGLSFLKLVKLVHLSVPIVVFSCSRSDYDIRRCFELGVQDFVTKPSDLDSYRRVVSHIVHKWGSPRLYAVVVRMKMNNKCCNVIPRLSAELTTAARLCYEALVEMAVNYGEPSKHAELVAAFQQAHQRVDHALAAFEEHVREHRSQENKESAHQV